MVRRTFTLPEAARAADTTVPGLLRAIEDGLLPAERVSNTGDYHIAEEDLAQYLKSTRHDELAGRPRRKILILGEELLLAGTVKLEFQRDPRLAAKFASWGRDAVLLVHHFAADLYLVDLSPCTSAPEDALIALAEHRRESARVVAYSIQTPDEISGDPLYARRLSMLRPDGLVWRGEGMRGLLVECYRQLELDTDTAVLRRKA